MVLSSRPTSGSGTHVDAYRSTGSSPGRGGRTRVTFSADLGASVDTDVIWEAHGPAHAPAVVVLGGISAGSHLLPTGADPTPGWWPGIVGRSRALDPDRVRLVGVDFLDLAPSPDGPPTTADQARAVAAVLDDLGVPDATLVGASYGGMVALAFAALFPRRTSRVVAICAAHRSHPMATAWRSVQRGIVRLAGESGRAPEGLALARGLAMTTYRSAREFESRFDGAPVLVQGAARFPVDAYLEARGRDFARRYPPERFLRLSESLDLHGVDPGTVACPTTLVSFDTDTLVPPWLVDELERSLPGPCRHVRLSTVYGHDAFLKEDDRLSAVLRDAVSGEGAR